MNKQHYLQTTINGSLGILALLGLWLGGTTIGIHIASKPYKEHWEALKLQYPKQPPNASAEKIAELMELMDLIKDDALTKQLLRIRQQWKSDPYATLKIIPTPLATYLQIHKETIEDIKDTLLSQATPKLTIDIESILPFDPNFKITKAHFLKLHQLLLVSAWQAEQDADKTLAQEYLKASEILVESLWGDTFLLLHLVAALAITENHLAFIRYSSHPYEWKLFSSPEVMGNTILSHFNEELSWIVTQNLSCGSDCYDTLPKFVWQVPWKFMIQPYFDWMLLDTIRVWKQRISELAQDPDICSWVMKEFQAQDQKRKLPLNNPLLTGENDTSLYHSFSRAARIQLQAELTQKIYDLKMIRIQQGHWPKSIPGIEVSSVCPNQQWSYSVLPDTTMIFKLANNIQVDDPSQIPLIYGALPENNTLDFDIIFISGPRQLNEKYTLEFIMRHRNLSLAEAKATLKLQSDESLKAYQDALESLMTVGVGTLTEAEAILDSSKHQSILQVSSLAEAERIQKQLESVDIKVIISKVIPDSFLEPS